jgi:hypothetical protein
MFMKKNVYKLDVVVYICKSHLFITQKIETGRVGVGGIPE